MALTVQQREIFLEQFGYMARAMLDIQREGNRILDEIVAFDILNDADFLATLSTDKLQDLQNIVSLAKSYDLMMDGDEPLYPIPTIFGGADPSTWVSNSSLTPRVEFSKYTLGR